MKITAVAILTLLLLACGTYNRIDISGDLLPVEGSATPNRIDSIVKPYSDNLEEEMNVVIAYSETNLTKGRPNAKLNNWSADALLQQQLKNSDKTGAVVSLLNVGGLRNSLNSGDVTIGDMYRLMPFDNEVVWVKMPMESLEKIAEYLSASGGEPIAGMVLKNGKMELSGEHSEATYFWVITSDYLMNGGDKMTFFEDRLEAEYAGILLRDVFIEVAREQKLLVVSDEKRIFL